MWCHMMVTCWLYGSHVMVMWLSCNHHVYSGNKNELCDINWTWIQHMFRCVVIWVTKSPTVFMSSGSSLQDDLDIVEQQFQGANNTVGNFSDCTILHQVHTHDSSLMHLYMCEWLYISRTGIPRCLAEPLQWWSVSIASSPGHTQILSHSRFFSTAAR